MIASSTTAIQSSVLALNRQFVAVHIVSVRRAFCLLYKGSAEVISVVDGSFQAFDFESWLEDSLLRSELFERESTSLLASTTTAGAGGQYASGSGTGLDEAEDWIQSVNFQIQVPRVIRLLDYERMPKNSVKFNRRNIFLRDENLCQYCGRRYHAQRLSLDHVIPKSRGGPTTWDNIVCCCIDCNVRKGGRTPGEANMRLLKPPRKPQRNPLLFHFLNSRKYQSWRMFLTER